MLAAFRQVQDEAPGCDHPGLAGGPSSDLLGWRNLAGALVLGVDSWLQKFGRGAPTLGHYLLVFIGESSEPGFLRCRILSIRVWWSKPIYDPILVGR